jgi:hypothetical protein
MKGQNLINVDREIGRYCVEDKKRKKKRGLNRLRSRSLLAKKKVYMARYISLLNFLMSTNVQLPVWKG